MNYYIFDFDGVLGDTLEASIKVNMTINGLPADAYEESLESIKRYLDFPKHNRQLELTPEEKATLLQHYVRWGQLIVEEGFSLFEGFIRELKSLNGVAKMAVVTSGSQLYVKPMLQASGVIFDEILTIEDGLSKEDKVERVCNSWGVSTQEVFYITDTTGDVHELSTLLNVNNIYGVSWGWHGSEHLITALPFSQILEHFSDIALVTHKPKVLCIGGGESYISHDHYLNDLHKSAARLETKSPSTKWRHWLVDTLNTTGIYSAYCLPMPNSQNAVYEEWKIQFEKVTRFFNSNDILVGHSLGGIFLAQYLSQNPLKLHQVHFVAAPFNGCFSFDFDSALLPVLHQNITNIHFYHSTDDFVVPFNQFLEFKKVLPTANFHQFEDKNHFYISMENFPELAEEIRRGEIH